MFLNPESRRTKTYEYNQFLWVRLIINFSRPNTWEVYILESNNTINSIVNIRTNIGFNLYLFKKDLLTEIMGM